MEILKNNFNQAALFLATLLIQLVLRFMDLDFHGIWRDEVASLYFSRHLSEVLTGDSHSIFYYLLLSPVPSGYLREFHALLGVGFLICLFRVSWRVLTPYQWFFFHSLYGIHPLVFGFHRLARPYGLMIDLTAILIFLTLSRASSLKIFLTSFALSSLHPFGVIPPLFEALVKRAPRRPVILGILPICLYYGVKFLVDPGPTSYVSWIHVDPVVFIGKVNDMLLGSYFPFYQFDTGIPGKICLAGGLLAAATARSRKFFYSFLGLYLSVILLPTVLSFVMDLRIERYYIFLFPYFLVAITLALPPLRLPIFIMTALIVLLIEMNVTWWNPFFRPQESFGDMMKRAKTLAALETGGSLIGCGHVYHNWYFRSQGFIPCDDAKEMSGLAGKKVIVAQIDGTLGKVLPFFHGPRVEVLERYNDGAILAITPKEASYDSQK